MLYYLFEWFRQNGIKVPGGALFQFIAFRVLLAVLFSLIYKSVDLQWFLYLSALQAALLAVTEFVVARGTSTHHGAKWCNAAAAIAAVSAARAR